MPVNSFYLLCKKVLVEVCFSRTKSSTLVKNTELSIVKLDFSFEDYKKYLLFFKSVKSFIGLKYVTTSEWSCFSTLHGCNVFTWWPPWKVQLMVNNKRKITIKVGCLLSLIMTSKFPCQCFVWEHMLLSVYSCGFHFWPSVNCFVCFQIGMPSLVK